MERSLSFPTPLSCPWVPDGQMPVGDHVAEWTGGLRGPRDQSQGHSRRISQSSLPLDDAGQQH